MSSPRRTDSASAAPGDGTSPQRTAEHLLDAGVALMRDHFEHADRTLGAGYQFISPTQVAARAGVSKGMIYHLWGRGGGRAFDRYVAELAERVLEPLAAPEVLQEALTDLHDQGMTFGEATAVMADFELHNIVHDPDRRTGFAQQLSLMAYAANPAVRDSLDRSSRRSYEQLAEFYDYGLRLYGKRLKTHDGDGRALTLVDLARVVSCLVEGVANEAMHSPDVMASDIAWTIDDRQQPISMLAIALMALIDAVTEDIPADTRMDTSTETRMDTTTVTTADVPTGAPLSRSNCE